MLDFLKDALKKDLAPLLSPLWDSLVLWRTIGLLAALAVVVGFMFRARLRDFVLRPSRMTHDADIFEKSDAILPETLFRSCMTGLWNANQYRLDDMTRLYTFAEFFERAGNQYLSRKLSRRLRDFNEALDDLLEFTSKHLFPLHSGDPERCALHPDLKVADNAAYQRYAEELAIKVALANVMYGRYRTAVKRCLLK